MGKGYIWALGAIWVAIFMAIKINPLLMIPVGVVTCVLVVRGLKPAVPRKDMAPAIPKGLSLSFQVADNDDILLIVTNTSDTRCDVPKIHLWLAATVYPDGSPGFGGNAISSYQTNFSPDSIGTLDAGQSYSLAISAMAPPLRVVPHSTPLRKFSSVSDDTHAQRENRRAAIARRVAKTLDDAPSLSALLRDKNSPYFLDARFEGDSRRTELSLQPKT
ncbi:MAG: hypothetical protein KC439_11765 [Yoonia sp.]|nr:hypothetical protein [Yoonia sp.]